MSQVGCSARFGVWAGTGSCYGPDFPRLGVRRPVTHAADLRTPGEHGVVKEQPLLTVVEVELRSRDLGGDEMRTVPDQGGSGCPPDRGNGSGDRFVHQK